MAVREKPAKLPPGRRTSIYVTDDEIAIVDEIAKQLGTSRSGAYRKLAQHGISDWWFTTPPTERVRG